MTRNDEMDAAALWHVRQNADDMDWQAFTGWLEADPRHTQAFDAIALLDDAIDRHRSTLRRLGSLPEVVPTRSSHRRQWGIAGSAAAVAAAILLFVTAYQETPPVAAPTYRAGTVPRDVRIADARITLAPGSRITTKNGDTTRLALSGRAVFAIAHDPTRSIAVHVEGYEVRDVGTRFEIVAGAGNIRVSVAEGEVTVRSPRGGAPIHVAAGQTATGFADGRIATARARSRTLDGWRTGPLVYDAMPISLVAADVARATHRSIVVDADVATRPFSGVLARGESATMIDALATLSGLEARRQGDTIHLGDRARR